MDSFLDFVDGGKMIFHNASFDMKFINHELIRIERAAIPLERVLDTLALARRKHPAGPNSLDALCKRYNIDNSARTKHGALLDAELLADVYLQLIGGQQPNFDLTARRGGGAGSAASNIILPRPQPLPANLADAELRGAYRLRQGTRRHARLGPLRIGAGDTKRPRAARGRATPPPPNLFPFPLSDFRAADRPLVICTRNGWPA